MIATKPPLNLYAKISKLQARMRPLERTGFNPHFGSAYVTLPEIWEAIRPALDELGLLIQNQTYADDEGQWLLETSIIDAETGERIVTTLPIHVANPSNPHQWGSWLSYATRYNLRSLTMAVGLDEDDDGNLAAQAAARREAAREKAVERQRRRKARQQANRSQSRQQRNDAGGMDVPAQTKWDVTSKINAAAVANADFQFTDTEERTAAQRRQGMIGAVRGKLGRIFGDREIVHKFLEDVYGTHDLNELTDGQILALFKWIGASSPDWEPAPRAYQEAQFWQTDAAVNESEPSTDDADPDAAS